MAKCSLTLVIAVLLTNSPAKRTERTMPEHEFKIRGARIRYNLAGNRGCLFSFPDGEDFRAVAIMTLLGWSRDTCRVEDCALEVDDSLPPGAVVISPLYLEARR